MSAPEKTSFAQRDGERWCLRPIGVVRSPHKDKMQAPRQPAAARGIEGRIELLPGHGFEHALEGLDRWEHLWVVFLFDRNEGWRPKVLPPRSSGGRLGVFATRSPHRPNPIGLSVLRLLRVEGLVLHVADLDLLEGTPVLDLKPYVAYTDALPASRAGWLEAQADPGPMYEVAWADTAREQAAFVESATGLALHVEVSKLLSLGPQPHAYRRIRADGPGFRLAYRDWRVFFTVADKLVTVCKVTTGHRRRDLEGPAPELAPHRAFVARFGEAKAPW